MKILLSDEKYFDIDGVSNSQNDRVWTVNRADADEKSGVKQRQKHPPSSNGVARCPFQRDNVLDSLQ